MESRKAERGAIIFCRFGLRAASFALRAYRAKRSAAQSSSVAPGGARRVLCAPGVSRKTERAASDPGMFDGARRALCAPEITP